MTLASDIGMQPTRRSDQGSEIVLGEDWDRPAGAVESELRDARAKRGFVALRGSPLARKILVFNTIALVVLVGGVLFVNSFRDSLVLQRERALAVEAQLVADIFEASLPRTAPANLVTRDGIDPEEVLGRIGLDRGLDVYVYAPDASLVASTDSIETAQAPPIEGITDPNFTTQPITDFLNWFWDVIAGALSSSDTTREPVSAQDMAEAMIGEALEGVTVLRGFPQGSSEAFKKRLAAIWSTRDAAGSLGIDPRLFRAFNIEAAPSFVMLSTEFSPCDGFDCTSEVPPHDLSLIHI